MLREKVAGYRETLEGRQTRTVVDGEGREHVHPERASIRPRRPRQSHSDCGLVMGTNRQDQQVQEIRLRHTTVLTPAWRHSRKQLAAAMREIEGLRLQRDVAMKIATWGGRRRRDDEPVAATGES